jgi:hypothetical protein
MDPSASLIGQTVEPTYLCRTQACPVRTPRDRQASARDATVVPVADGVRFPFCFGWSLDTAIVAETQAK